MKTQAILILPVVLLAVCTSFAQGTSPRFANVMIDPGHGVGPLKLGDGRDRALELFPKKDEDQQWDDSCGSTIDWVDTTNPMGRGDLNIRMKKGKIFQIESSTSRFETPEGHHHLRRP